MKKIFFSILAVAALMIPSGCTEDNIIDTGTANGIHNTTMWEYFKSDPYNWDSLRVMADHAGMRDVFEGKSKAGNNITFFGITNHSIRRYMLDKGIGRITDMPKVDCKKMIEDCILPKRVMLDEFVAGRPSATADKVIGTGGETLAMMSGKNLWIYKFQESYNGVPEAGAWRVYIVSAATAKSRKVASHNIQTNTGVVHSLQYEYTPGDF